MRIQEVMGKTGLSRRTIHYYIDQKLIIPPVNEGNGYHDFTGEDVQKLFIIRKLREAGLSLADIRAILRKPRTTPFYLHNCVGSITVLAEMSSRGCKSIPAANRQIHTPILFNFIRCHLSSTDMINYKRCQRL